MLLRSSSTPVLGSLLSSFSESPCNSMHFETILARKHLPPLPTTSVPHHNHKLSFHQTGPINLSFSSTSSPISPSIADLDRHRGFRRAQSEGNLEDLAYASCKKSLFTLDTIQSFSFSSHKGLREEEEEEGEESDFEEEEEEWEEENGISSTMEGVKSLIVTEDERVENGVCSVGFDKQEKMSVKETHPAMELGTEGCGDGMGGCRGGDGGSGDHNSMGSGGHDGERHEVEEYYKRMVEENPGNPLFLRNYAQFLYQYKRDHRGAEEYYSRAILADPEDGEVLSMYGKLVWELQRDQDRASSYFERAVQASPQDSHVQAAYASFLWETEEDENGCSEPECSQPHFHEGAMVVSAGA
ncbi:uncharacterized protein LOC129304958 [Prosopis cineraria]|uniref:uncharacterized protein LOC129304958 n=1 Tax=Prosopis cineraria TaxID=364024 RepID=UPI00240F0CF9|nr:uncharacterized protein LOC129304958 [Prosopis cineraria]